MSKKTVSLADIQEAKARITPYIRRTPLLDQTAMNDEVGCKVWLKPEMLQYVGAFKLRGALNKILSLSEEDRQRGIITSSSGNHAQACAFAGQLLHCPVVVVIPEDAPQIKINNARAMGAEVVLWERTYDARWAKIAEMVKEHNYVVVHPYEDPMVMAGQGTLGLEILEDLPDVDTVLVPIGGGGLISGVSTAIKETNPNVRVVGVQAAASAAYYESRKAGECVGVEPLATVADGLSCRRASQVNFDIIERYVDEIVTVEEDAICEALRVVANRGKLIAEPSACVGIAALLSGAVKVRPDEKVVSILTAGNWNIEDVARIYLGEAGRAVH
ncbi:MAG: threonine/serine dehydratase [Lachnospiraceae bacterium]|nr:threonine/serine dehydratase [Lachnospiraceae bacterium]